jgi:hypothetical protein
MKQYKIVDGILCERKKPKGDWKHVNLNEPKAKAVMALYALPNKERLCLINLFCAECGDAVPSHLCCGDVVV